MIGTTLRWLAACALLMASALAFATGDAEQSASASAGAGAAISGRFSEADPGWRAAETPTFPYGSNLTIQIAARTGGRSIGTVGEAPNILLTNNDLRNVPTEFPVSNTDWKGNLMYWADQLWLNR